MADALKIQAVPVELGPCRMKLDIEVPAELADKTYRQMLTNVNSQAKLPGFRAGHIPPKVLLENYGPMVVAETTNRLVQNAYKEVSGPYREKMIGDPIMSKETETAMYEAGKPFKFSLEFETYPTFDLPNYKGLHLKVEKRTVTDEMVNHTIEDIREQASRYETVQGPTVENDLLTVSHHAEPTDGKEKPENKYGMLDTEKTWIALREPEMYPGVAKGLLGLSVDEERELEIKFPEEFHLDELKGRSFKYTFKVLEIRRAVKPELNDEFAKTQGFDTVEKLTEQVRAYLTSQLEMFRKNVLVQQIHEQVLYPQTFALPADALKDVVAQRLKGLEDQARREGKSDEDIAKSHDEMAAKAQKDGENEMRAYYTLENIAKAEKLHVETADIMEYQRMLDREKGRRSLKAVLREKQESGEISNFMVNRLFDKVYDLIIKEAEVTETEPEAPKAETEQK